jgi:superfamily II DNA/RNA helicase
MPSTVEDTVTAPLDNVIQSDVERIFGVRPCLSQIHAARAQLKQNTDILYISGTGSGKTLTFWIPML